MFKPLIPLSAVLIAATITSYSADDTYRSDDYYDSCCCNRLEFWFDPMGVQSCQMNTQFAQQDIAQSQIVANTVINFLDPDSSFGFKLGAQIESNCPTWVFGIQYMWWENTVKGAVTLRGTGQIIELADFETNLEGGWPEEGYTIPLFAEQDVGSIKTRLKYNYNLLDVYGGWNCCLCQGLQLTSYGGFRGWWYGTEVSQLAKNSANLFVSPRGDTSTATNDLKAFGIMGGLGFEWNVCRQFYFFGSFGGSIVSGDNHDVIKLVATGVLGTTRTFDTTQCLFMHSVEGKFGFNWKFCICDTDYQVGAYYEVIQWNQVLPNSFEQVRTVPGSATKTLNGLFLQQIAGRFGVSF